MEALTQSAPERSEERPGEPDQRRAGLALMVLATILAGALILWLERGTTYMSDEWAWIGYASNASVLDTLRPINGHLSVIPLLVSKLSLSLWGTDIFPLKIVQLIGVLASGWILYAFSRRRVGPLVALAPAMVPMFLGTGAAILLQPLIGLQVIYSLAFGAGALLAVERGSRGGDIVACLLMILSLASFSIGIAFLAGLALAILLFPDSLRRAYVFVVPLALYGAWWLWAQKYSPANGPEISNVPAIPFYYVDSIASVATALFGRAVMIGPGPGTSLFVQGFTLEQASAFVVFAAVEVVAIFFLARRLARRRPLPPMFWATLGTVLALWTIQALVLTEGRTPGQPRYIYPGAVVLALFVVEAARRVRLSRLAVGIILALTVVGIAGNMPRFKEGRDAIDYHAPRNLSYIGLMDLEGSNADPNFYPATDTPAASPAGALSVSVQGYQELSARYGGFGYSPERILEQNDEIRHGSDEVLVGMLRLGLVPASEGSGGGGCSTAKTSGGGLKMTLPRGGALLRAGEDTPVFLRRFAAQDGEGVAVGRLEAGRPALLRIPADSARLPWVLEAPRAGSLRVCAIGAGGA
jgi:hypothetical protein